MDFEAWRHEHLGGGLAKWGSGVFWYYLEDVRNAKIKARTEVPAWKKTLQQLGFTPVSGSASDFEHASPDLYNLWTGLRDRGLKVEHIQCHGTSSGAARIQAEVRKHNEMQDNVRRRSLCFARNVAGHRVDSDKEYRRLGLGECECEAEALCEVCGGVKLDCESDYEHLMFDHDSCECEEEATCAKCGGCRAEWAKQFPNFEAGPCCCFCKTCSDCKRDSIDEYPEVAECKCEKEAECPDWLQTRVSGQVSRLGRRPVLLLRARRRRRRGWPV
eukprot:732653-Rhodomonas_salina.1